MVEQTQAIQPRKRRPQAKQIGNIVDLSLKELHRRLRHKPSGFSDNNLTAIGRLGVEWVRVREEIKNRRAELKVRQVEAEIRLRSLPPLGDDVDPLKQVAALAGALSSLTDEQRQALRAFQLMQIGAVVTEPEPEEEPPLGIEP